MQTEPEERQERIDTTNSRTSPSAGWKEVYAEMGVSPSGDAEDRATAKRDEPSETDGRPAERSERVRKTSVERPLV